MRSELEGINVCRREKGNYCNFLMPEFNKGWKNSKGFGRETGQAHSMGFKFRRGKRIMAECIFCSIVRGSAPAVKVYESEDVLVFMDKQPITRGHMLAIPKRHSELLTEVDDALVGQMFNTAKKMGLALKKCKLGAKGVNYIVADGAEAGQEVFHVHIHIVPRYRGDGFGFRMPPRYEEETGLKELEKAAAKIAKVL